MASVTGDFELTHDELRAVARYATTSAQSVLTVFESARPGDLRPRRALDAAREFIDGAPRASLQRVASLDAHRAAKDAPTEVARLAAQAAGDAAAAAYLHPIRKSHQVGHILRATANAVRIAEIEAGDESGFADRMIEQLRERTDPVVVDVLRRYPPVPAGRSRAAQLLAALDSSVRAAR